MLNAFSRDLCSSYTSVLNSSFGLFPYTIMSVLEVSEKCLFVTCPYRSANNFSPPILRALQVVRTIRLGH